jgi:large subunit ribosomal protein L5
MSRLQEHYNEVVVKKMMEKFKYTTPMQVPKIVKIVVNMRLAEALQNSKAIQNAEVSLVSISGQKPKVAKSKKHIAAFKLRAGVPIGLLVTLRKKRMYDFLDRLISLALPRVRDFKGIPRTGFDGNGNYTFGIKDQSVFTEIDYEKVDKVRGMDLTFVTSATTNEEGFELLELIGLPFVKSNK